VTDRDGNTLDKSLEIRAQAIGYQPISRYFNSFTPNGDGMNDHGEYLISVLQQGARNPGVDRSGQRLFYTENPDVRWDGMFEGKEMR